MLRTDLRSTILASGEELWSDRARPRGAGLRVAQGDGDANTKNNCKNDAHQPPTHDVDRRSGGARPLNRCGQRANPKPRRRGLACAIAKRHANRSGGRLSRLWTLLPARDDASLRAIPLLVCPLLLRLLTSERRIKSGRSSALLITRASPHARCCKSDPGHPADTAGASGHALSTRAQQWSRGRRTQSAMQRCPAKRLRKGSS